MRNVKVAFQVEELEGSDDIDTTVMVEGVMRQSKKSIPRGWMVYFPNGHSVRIRKEKEMVRLGFLQQPSLVDMETGEEVVPSQSMSLKELNQMKNRIKKVGSIEVTGDE